MLKSSKTNILADGLIERTSWNEIVSYRWNSIKNCINAKKVIDRGKWGTTMNEVMPVKNINQNLQGFIEISLVQK